MPKRSLRQKLLTQRRMLSDAECLQRSRSLQQAFLATDEYRQASVIALYAPIHNEVRTEYVFETALRDRKRVCFPRVKKHHIEFVPVADPSELTDGAFGIAEPAGNDVVTVDDIDIVVVPGVGFDRLGFRLGYGRGYYDRSIGTGREVKLAGLAYDFQVVDELPAEDHDVRINLLVMESGRLQFDQ